MRKLEIYKMIRENKHPDCVKLDSFGKITAEQLEKAGVVLFQYKIDTVYVMPMRGYKPLRIIYTYEGDSLLEITLQNFIQDRINSKIQVKQNAEKKRVAYAKVEKQYLHIDFYNAHFRAIKIAKQEVQSELKKYPNGEPELACGFAWVTVYGVRKNSETGRVLRDVGYEWCDFRKAYSLWKPANYNGQCVMIHEVGADAYARVFRDAGIKAYSYSRLD